MSPSGRGDGEESNYTENAGWCWWWCRSRSRVLVQSGGEMEMFNGGRSLVWVNAKYVVS